MMKTKELIFVTFLLFSINIAYSQITIGNIEKRQDTMMIKPVTYDSLNNFTKQDNDIDYKQYIRLKIYMPPFKNPEVGKYISDEPLFLFTNKPTKIQINKSLKLAEYDNVGTISKDYSDILTCVYLPFHYFSGLINGSTSVGIVTNADEISNKYFTILDILSGQEAKEKWYETEKNISITERRNKNKQLYVNRQRVNTGVFNFIILKLRNDEKGDTLYCLNPYKFILVPYFVKQQMLFNKKNLIATANDNSSTPFDIVTNKVVNVKSLSRWSCEVSLLKQSQVYPNFDKKFDRYDIFYILRNELNETIAVDQLQHNNYGLHFILEDEYNSIENEKQLKKEELLVKKRKEEQDRIDKERKHHQDCVNKFGTSNGALVAQGKVVIGMSKEMCEVAWGKPFDIYKTTTISGTSETWYYSWKYILHFDNGKLDRIEN